MFVSAKSTVKVSVCVAIKMVKASV